MFLMALIANLKFYIITGEKTEKKEKVQTSNEM